MDNNYGSMLIDSFIVLHKVAAENSCTVGAMGQCPSLVDKKFIFAYPIACIVIRYFVRPIIYGKLQMNFYCEVMTEYLTNYMCFLALSVELFSILFIYGIVKNIIAMLVVDTVVLIGVLIRGLAKKNSGTMEV